MESSRAHWDARMLTIATTFEVDDRTAGKPFTAELTRKFLAGIGDHPGRRSDSRRRARRVGVHDARDLSKSSVG